MREILEGGAYFNVILCKNRTPKNWINFKKQRKKCFEILGNLKKTVIVT